MFPLIKLAKKLKGSTLWAWRNLRFPLIKLAKKLKEAKLPRVVIPRKAMIVSIN